MKILITGATGFIGSHLIFELLKNKSNKIIATSKSTNKAMKFGWYSKVKYIEFDFNNSYIWLKKWIKITIDETINSNSLHSSIARFHQMGWTIWVWVKVNSRMEL